MGECVVVDLDEYKRVKNGCVLIAREIDQSPVMDCAPVVREVWFYFLRKVTHKDKKFNRISLTTRTMMLFCSLGI